MQAEVYVALELRRIGDEFNQLYFQEVRNLYYVFHVCSLYREQKL